MRASHLADDIRVRNNELVRYPSGGGFRVRARRSQRQVDTAAGKWRDSGNGGGIVPDESSIFKPASDEEEEGDAGRSSRSRSGSVSSGSLSSASDSYSASSVLQDNEAGWVQRHVQGVTPSGVRKQILRKTVRWVASASSLSVIPSLTMPRRNTWIYVVDMQMNMFVGIKHTGVFQHSSCTCRS
jgi:hypothetical protein